MSNEKQKAMKQKTAIRQLIEFMETTPFVGKEIYNKAKELEPVNEQQIKDAYLECWVDDGGMYETKMKQADEYLTKTFEKP